MFIAGRGLKSGENFELLYQLAEKMNAAGTLIILWKLYGRLN